MIIAAFAATGKSYFCNENKGKAIDFVCMPFKYENFFEISKGIEEESESIKGEYELELIHGWEAEYFEAIKAIEKANSDLCIVIPPVSRVLYLLKIAGIKYIIIYPNEKLLSEYIERCLKRGNTEDFINILISCWTSWINSAKADEWAEKIELASGQYLTYVLSIGSADYSAEIAKYREKYLSEKNRQI